MSFGGFKPGKPSKEKGKLICAPLAKKLKACYNIFIFILITAIFYTVLNSVSNFFCITIDIQ